jgi:2-keto-4-pentenoate hydratase
MIDQNADQNGALAGLAQRLEDAWTGRTTMVPLSEAEGLDSAESAYAIQSRWTDLRVALGDRIIGRKIGLTSRAMQEQIKVDEPDYGTLWASRFFAPAGGRASMPAEVFIQPRAEGEFAFLIGRPLTGPHVTPQEVLSATEAIAVSIEVIDSRINDWRIRLVDTVADNASYGAFTLGPWNRALRRADLRTLGLLIQHNGVPVVEGVGAAVLGHPARAVAWLANKLNYLGVGLRPGDIVLSGSVGRSIPVRRGDVFMVETYDQPPLSVVFE